MKVCVVIVTYDNRYHFVEQVVEVINKEVDKVIIVDNNSTEESKRGLERLSHRYRDKIKIIRNSRNLGSAGGFKVGLQEAYGCSECEFLWLLDDDNKPSKGALNALKNFWLNLNLNGKETKVALLSFRPIFNIYKKAIEKRKPELVLCRKNSFLGVNFIDLPIKIARRFYDKVKRSEEGGNNLEKKWGVVSVAPYGGLFFHKKLLDIIGYPDERYFTYVDDHEFTYRITKNGGEIILVMDSMIEDMEISWGLGQSSKNPFYTPLLDTEDYKRLYYFVRNRVNFENRFLVSNENIYKLNMCLFFWIIGSIAFLKKNGLKKLAIIREAVRDGLNNNFYNNNYVWNLWKDKS